MSKMRWYDVDYELETDYDSTVESTRVKAKSPNDALVKVKNREYVVDVWIVDKKDFR